MKMLMEVVPLFRRELFTHYLNGEPRLSCTWELTNLHARLLKLKSVSD